METGETPERLSADELAYHQFVLNEYRARQSALDSWMFFLANKHRLAPTDRIQEDGTICREPPPAGPADPPG